jgi:hypothetical protein
MTDVILIATIVAFFLAAALLVRALDRVVAPADDAAGPEDGAAGQDTEPGSEPGISQRISQGIKPGRPA